MIQRSAHQRFLRADEARDREAEVEILLTYDVATDTAEGRRRLRQMAKACEGYGQRVQKSVFECTLSAAQLELLKRRLSSIVDPKQDSLRIYRLQEPRERYLQVIGKRPAIDLHDPIVV